MGSLVVYICSELPVESLGMSEPSLHRFIVRTLYLRESGCSELPVESLGMSEPKLCLTQVYSQNIVFEGVWLSIIIVVSFQWKAWE